MAIDHFNLERSVMVTADVERGASVDDQERESVVGYLAENYGP